MSRPLVTVIVPAKNAAAHVQATLDSLSGQSLGDFEALIVDDGSTDATREIVLAHAERDPRFVLFASGGNGVADARNEGLACSRGRYVAFLDADDIATPDSLAMRADWLQQNRNGRLIACAWNVIGPKGEELGLQQGRIGGPRRFDTAFAFPAHMGAVMGRGALLRQFRFESGRAHGEDHDYLIRILRAGCTLQHDERVALHYRWHGASAVSRNRTRHVEALITMLERLGAAQPAGPYVAAEFAEGWAMDSIRPRQLKLLYQLAVELVLAGADSEMVERVAARCDAGRSFAELPPAALDVEDIWVASVRVLVLPNKSPALCEQVCENVGGLLALAARLSEHARFAAAVRAFVDQALDQVIKPAL